MCVHRVHNESCSRWDCVGLCVHIELCSLRGGRSATDEMLAPSLNMSEAPTPMWNYPHGWGGLTIVKPSHMNPNTRVSTWGSTPSQGQCETIPSLNQSLLHFLFINFTADHFVGKKEFIWFSHHRMMWSHSIVGLVSISFHSNSQFSNLAVLVTRIESTFLIERPDDVKRWLPMHYSVKGNAISQFSRQTLWTPELWLTSSQMWPHRKILHTHTKWVYLKRRTHTIFLKLR